MRRARAGRIPCGRYRSRRARPRRAARAAPSTGVARRCAARRRCRRARNRSRRCNRGRDRRRRASRRLSSQRVRPSRRSSQASAPPTGRPSSPIAGKTKISSSGSCLGEQPVELHIGEHAAGDAEMCAPDGARAGASATAASRPPAPAAPMPPTSSRLHLFGERADEARRSRGRCARIRMHAAGFVDREMRARSGRRASACPWPRARSPCPRGARGGSRAPSSQRHTSCRGCLTGGGRGSHSSPP